MAGPFWGSFFGALAPGIVAVLFAWAAYLKARAGAVDSAEAKAHGEKNGIKLDSLIRASPVANPAHHKRG